MAWVLQHPSVTTVLVGARTVAQLENALSAARLVLAPEWLKEIAAWDATPAAPR
jgi:aryl-alcohol dehydrogenase-like predicted oxidoreductase